MIQQSTRGTILTLVAGCLLALLSGCSRGHNATVSGTVSMEGNKLGHGTIAFCPQDKQGVVGYGDIAPDGSYIVRAAGAPGLPAGEYSVTVAAREPPTTPKGALDMPKPGKSLVPERYSSVPTSGLQFTVQPGDNRFDLELKP